MPAVEQTPLPGVGVRYDFTTREGRRLGVVHQLGGHKELHVSSAEDPDASPICVGLGDDEVHTLVEVLGGAQVTASLARLQEYVEGITIEWLQVGTGSPIAERSLAEAGIRTRSGVSVVAVLRAGTTRPAPGPDFRIEAGDTLVVVGTPEGIAAAAAVVRGS